MADRIVALTGAGVSAESGLSTFRDKDGIWSRVRIEDVATPEAFARDPDRVLSFYRERLRVHETAAPNAAHHALARLEAGLGDRFLLVTQNIDNLHRAAGSRRVSHMHGEIHASRCAGCGRRWRGAPMWYDAPACADCGDGRLRPDVVWFGEIPYGLEEIEAALLAADLFVSIGTSGAVYPAAGFVGLARRAGARTLELNLEPSEGARMFDEARHGLATRVVPEWVEEVLGAR